MILAAGIIGALPFLYYFGLLDSTGEIICYGAELPTNLTFEKQDYTVDSLFIALLSNGDASVDYNMIIRSAEPIINVTLFGETARNLTLMDYNGTNIRYISTERSDRIRVQAQPQDNIHVTYITPDFVDKQNRNWTFSFFFNDKFLLKFPDNARVIVMQPQPFLSPTYEQNLWGFGPGDVKVKYVIGPLGTKEEAQASIRFIEAAIEETKTNYNGLVMANISSFVNQTKSLFNEGKYLDAVNYATKTNEVLQDISDSYLLGQDSISQAEIELRNKKVAGYDTLRAEELLATAKSLFSLGHYKNASSTANLASGQVSLQYNSSILNFSIVIILAIILVAVAIIFFILRRRLKTRIVNKNLQQLEVEDSKGNLDDSTSQAFVHEFSFETKPEKSSSPINVLHGSSPDEAEIREYVNQVVREVNNVRADTLEEKVIRGGIFSSQLNATTEKSQLGQLVAQMKLKKPYLRVEEKELLDFLAEKRGTAFESEVRKKFVLPRTSLWRLVKRLEREELLEVIKIGGQNMIRLRSVNDRSGS